MHRRKVLGLYRRIFREARVWEPEAEREGIRDEARTLFRRKRTLADDDVPAHLFEAESRIELAKHYGNAAPRFFYSQKGTDARDIPDKFVKGDYLKSYDWD